MRTEEWHRYFYVSLLKSFLSKTEITWAFPIEVYDVYISKCIKEVAEAFKILRAKLPELPDIAKNLIFIQGFRSFEILYCN
jgi:hypothetical protein